MMPGSLDNTCASIVNILSGRSRITVGIAGPPGAGKSTLSSRLCEKLNLDGHATAIVPMDGFHLDNSILRERGLLSRKGAPETFDAEGFIALAEAIRTSPGPIPVPIFDRNADRVRKAAETIAPPCRIVLLEGNYLLLDCLPWSRLRPQMDLSIFVSAPPQILRERLIQRWLEHGHNRNEAEKRANGNDIRNATLVVEHSVPADIVITADPGD